MLVKELRQGLRTNTFVILFLVLQALLGLILLTTAAADTNAGTLVSGIIFCLFSLSVLVIQPLRGIGAISSEVKGDTIDLMVLTKLSAWRIVYGKWSSLIGQSALILSTIIPYLILRYFFGGMQLFSELLLLLSLFLLSGLFTALTIGVSGSALALVRVIPLIGAILLVFPIFMFAFGEFGMLLELFTPEDLDHWLILCGCYLLIIYLTYFFLELGTSFIAPAAENRATLKRLIAAPVVLLPTLLFLFIEEDMAWTYALVLLCLITFDLFTERDEFPSIVTRPFLRWGLMGRLIGRLLYPGWATGTLFHSLLFLLIMAAGFSFGSHLDSEELQEGTGIIFGALQFGLLLVNLFRRVLHDRFTAYILITTVLCVLIPLFGILYEVNSENMIWFFCFIPHIQPWMAFEIDPSKDISLMIIWGSAFAYFAVNLILAFPRLRQLSQLEEEELVIVSEKERKDAGES